MQIEWAKEFIVFRADILVCAFVICYKFITEHCVYFYIIMSLYNVSHTLKHNFFCIFKELARFDVSRVYHGTGYYTIFERGIDLSPNKSLGVTAVCTRIIIAKMSIAKTSLQSSLCTRELRDLGHQRLSISIRQSRTLSTAFVEPFNALIASLQPNTLPR